MFDFTTRSGEIRQFHVENVFKLFSSFPMVCKGKIKKFCVKKRHKTTYYFFPPESFRGIYNLSSTWRSPKYVTNMAKNLYFIFEVLLVLVRSGPTSFADTLSVNTWMWPFIVNNDGNIQYVSRLDFGKDTVQKYPVHSMTEIFRNYVLRITVDFLCRDIFPLWIGQDIFGPCLCQNLTEIHTVYSHHYYNMMISYWGLTWRWNLNRKRWRSMTSEYFIRQTFGTQQFRNIL